MTKTLLTGLIGVGVLASAGLCEAGTTRFILSDHPNGALRAPTYGLRLDNFFGDGAPVTFSFEQGGAEMKMDVRDNGPGDRSIRIYGTMFGGRDDKSTSTWSNPQLYSIDFTYREGVIVRGNGWEVDQSDDNFGTISSGNQIFDVGDVFNKSFYFKSDGYRIPNDGHRTWVGRGWLELDTGRVGYQDWLFTGQIIPLPSTAALAGLGLAGVAGYRRRRTL